MANTTKKSTTPKKEVKDKIEKKPVTTTVVGDVVETNKIEKVLENVDITISIDETPVSEPVFDEIQQVSELTEKFEELKENLEEQIKEEPEKAEEIIKESIEEAKSLKAEVEKIIESKPLSNREFTNWWNGQITM